MVFVKDECCLGINSFPKHCKMRSSLFGCFKLSRIMKGNPCRKRGALKRPNKRVVSKMCFKQTKKTSGAPNPSQLRIHHRPYIFLHFTESSEELWWSMIFIYWTQLIYALFFRCQHAVPWINWWNDPHDQWCKRCATKPHWSLLLRTATLDSLARTDSPRVFF